MKKIYFDYAASTPVDSRVLQAMEPYFGNSPARHARQRAGVAGWGNPGSLHSFGQEAIAAVDASRETIAKNIGAKPEEIIFTGSATEANNLALRGVVTALVNQRITNQTRTNEFANSEQIRYSLMEPRIIVSAIEHESVLETARDLEKDDAEVIHLPVDKNGVVDLDALKNALNERTVLVSVMYANNEIGTVQPISEIAEIILNFRKQIANRRAKSEKNNASRFALSALPLLHTDAAQAFQFLDCNVENLGVDLMTLSAHKIYGPKGIGVLYIRSTKYKARNPKQIQNANVQNSKRLRFKNSDLDIVSNLGFRVLNLSQLVSPIVTGGGQEFGLRSGTENVPSIVGFARAAELLFSSSQEHWNRKISGLRDYFWRELKKICPEAKVNGAQITARLQIADRTAQSEKNNASRFALSALPNILNVYFPNHEAQFFLTKIDLAGVAASSGSACRSRAMESSYVIEALGHSKERAKRSIRFSFGRPTTKKEIVGALKIIKECL